MNAPTLAEALMRIRHERRARKVHPVGQPDGDRRLRVHRVRGVGSRGHGQDVRAAGVHGRGAASAQEGDALSPGRDQLHPQRGARQLRAALRAPARPVDLRDRVPRRRCGKGVRARHLARRLGLRFDRRAGRAQHSRDQGHRRFDDLSRRSMARQGRRASRARSATSASTTSTSRRSRARRRIPPATASPTSIT